MIADKTGIMEYKGKEKYQMETGAYYTPKVWADLAVKYIGNLIPNIFDCLTFYDPAAGEGALLDALPKGTGCICSTLEQSDVDVLKNKGYDAFQMDFLNDPVPERIRQIPRLAVFMNPPYFKLKSAHDCYAKRRYKAHDSVQLFFYRVFCELNAFFVFAFSKPDLLQASTALRFRNETSIIERIIGNPFISPSTSWGLKGKFSIMFGMYRNFMPVF